MALAVKHPSYQISCQNADHKGRLYTSCLVHRISALPFPDDWPKIQSPVMAYPQCILETQISVALTVKQLLVSLVCWNIRSHFLCFLDFRIYGWSASKSVKLELLIHDQIHAKQIPQEEGNEIQKYSLSLWLAFSWSNVAGGFCDSSTTHSTDLFRFWCLNSKS